MASDSTNGGGAVREGESSGFEPYSAFEIPEDLRELHGRWDVEATARRIRNYRYAEEWMMMVLAGWIATIPELPVKTGLGKIIYQDSIHADWLGKRLPELRGGRSLRNASLPGNDGFAAFVVEISAPEAPEETIEKLVGVFRVLKPHLIEVYERSCRETDQIADAPTIELLEDILTKERQHVAWGEEVLGTLCNSEGKLARARRRERALTELLEKCGGVCGDLDLVRRD
jgi:hypothetical protein